MQDRTLWGTSCWFELVQHLHLFLTVWCCKVGMWTRGGCGLSLLLVTIRFHMTVSQRHWGYVKKCIISIEWLYSTVSLRSVNGITNLPWNNTYSHQAFIKSGRYATLAQVPVLMARLFTCKMGVASHLDSDHTWIATNTLITVVFTRFDFPLVFYLEILIYAWSFIGCTADLLFFCLRFKAFSTFWCCNKSAIEIHLTWLHWPISWSLSFWFWSMNEAANAGQLMQGRTTVH